MNETIFYRKFLLHYEAEDIIKPCSPFINSLDLVRIVLKPRKENSGPLQEIKIGDIVELDTKANSNSLNIRYLWLISIKCHPWVNEKVELGGFEIRSDGSGVNLHKKEHGSISGLNSSSLLKGNLKEENELRKTLEKGIPDFEKVNEEVKEKLSYLQQDPSERMHKCSKILELELQKWKEEEEKSSAKAMSQKEFEEKTDVYQDMLKSLPTLRERKKEREKRREGAKEVKQELKEPKEEDAHFIRRRKLEKNTSEIEEKEESLLREKKQKKQRSSHEGSVVNETPTSQRFGQEISNTVIHFLQDYFAREFPSMETLKKKIESKKGKIIKLKEDLKNEKLLFIQMEIKLAEYKTKVEIYEHSHSLH